MIFLLLTKQCIEVLYQPPIFSKNYKNEKICIWVIDSSCNQLAGKTKHIIKQY